MLLSSSSTSFESIESFAVAFAAAFSHEECKAAIAMLDGLNEYYRTLEHSLPFMAGGCEAGRASCRVAYMACELTRATYGRFFR
jgi:hypothetical protein